MYSTYFFTIDSRGYSNIFNGKKQVDKIDDTLFTDYNNKMYASNLKGTIIITQIITFMEHHLLHVLLAINTEFNIFVSRTK